MAQVLQGIPGVVYFIDDILVTGLKHQANLRRVLERFRDYGLQLKKSKCLFSQKELEFLGHFISQDGIKPKYRGCESSSSTMQQTSITIIFGHGDIQC